MFPIVFYLKRRQFRKTKVLVFDSIEFTGDRSKDEYQVLQKEKEALKIRDELIEKDALRKKRAALKQKLKGAKCKSTLMKNKRFNLRIKRNRRFTASHKFDMRLRPNLKFMSRRSHKWFREQDKRYAEQERLSHLMWLKKEKLKKLKGMKRKSFLKRRRKFKGKTGFTACRIRKCHKERRIVQKIFTTP